MPKEKTVDTGLALRVGPDATTEALLALGDLELDLLGAYLHFARRDGEPVGQAGVCWPTEEELGAYLGRGRSAHSIRRSRHVLASLAAPFIATRRVLPQGRLPSGAVAEHGAAVVTLLGSGAPGEGPLAIELHEAMSALRQLETQAETLRGRVDVLKERLEALRHGGAANDAAPSSHNAPRTRGLSKAPIERGGESRAHVA